MAPFSKSFLLCQIVAHHFPRPANGGHKVRHVLIDNDPWFVAADVCRILFKAFDKAAGTTQWLQGLAKDEKRVAKHTDEKTRAVFAGQSMVRTLSLVSESGLYKVILRARSSDNMTVRDFQDWVTCDVLPTIRKTGGYLLNEHMRSTAAARESHQAIGLDVRYEPAGARWSN